MLESQYRFRLQFILGLLFGFALFLAGCAGLANVYQDLVWPSAPDQPRIRYVGALTDGSVMPRSFFSKLFGFLTGAGGADVQMGKPLNVAVDDLGRVYVTDLDVRKVFVFDFVEERMRFLGDRGPEQLFSPMGIAVYDTLIFVTDNHMRQVAVFSSSGNRLHVIGDTETLANPVAVAYDPPTQRVFVLDARNNEVVVYSLEGKTLLRFGAARDWVGGLYFPSAMWIRDGKLYVVDSMAFRVVIYDLEGNFISTFGEPGSAPGFFARPKGIAVSQDGKIFVTDAAFNNFQIFDEKGQVYMFVGSGGSAPGQFQIPSGMFIDKNNKLFVVDQINRRVQIFQYLGSD